MYKQRVANFSFFRKRDEANLIRPLVEWNGPHRVSLFWTISFRVGATFPSQRPIMANDSNIYKKSRLQSLEWNSRVEVWNQFELAYLSLQ